MHSQRAKELVPGSHRGRRLSSPWQGFAVGGKGCERLSCHGNRSMEGLGSAESNHSTSIPRCHLSTTWHPATWRCRDKVPPPWVGTGSLTVLDTPRGFSLGGEMVCGAGVRHSNCGEGLREGGTDSTIPRAKRGNKDQTMDNILTTTLSQGCGKTSRTFVKCLKLEKCAVITVKYLFPFP